MEFQRLLNIVVDRGRNLGEIAAVTRQWCMEHTQYVSDCVTCDVYGLIARSWVDRGTSRAPPTPAIQNTAEAWKTARQHIEAAFNLLAQRDLADADDVVLFVMTASEDGIEAIRELAVQTYNNEDA